MLNKQTERTTGIQAENMNKQRNNLRKIKGKTRIGSLDWFDLRFETRIMLVVFFLSPANS